MSDPYSFLSVLDCAIYEINLLGLDCTIFKLSSGSFNIIAEEIKLLTKSEFTPKSYKGVLLHKTDKNFLRTHVISVDRNGLNSSRKFDLITFEEL